MKLNLHVEVSDESETTCGETCAFLHRGGCALFNVELDEITLKPGHEWQDVTMQRDYRCIDATS